MNTGNQRRPRPRALAASFALCLCWTLGCSGGVETAPATFTGEATNDIVEAVRVGDAETVAKLLDGNASLMEFRDDQGRTLMHVAVLSNQPDIVRLLVEKGMDPNVRDATGATALGALEQVGTRAEDAREAIIECGGLSLS